MKRKSISPIGMTWKDYAKSNFTKEEIEASKARLALLNVVEKAKKEKNLTQKDLEKISGVSQPVISRLMNGEVDSNITTFLKILIPLGYTISITKYKQNK